jgi:hypothetical protein
MGFRFMRAIPAATLVAVGLVGMAGCASSPNFVPVNHQRVVPLASTDVWKRVHQFLADENISVTSEDIASGIIDAERSVNGRGSLTGLANCGARPMHSANRQTLKLTILVKTAPEGAQITANAAFTETLAGVFASHQAAAALTVECPSTGVLEAAVLDVAGGQPMEAAIIPR